MIEKVNRSLRALRKRTVEALPPLRTEGPQPKVTDILSKPGLRKVTWLLAFGYMFHTLTFYYILKFAVQIVADSGFSQADAASTLTWANIGGAIGGGLFGFLLKKWDIKGPTIAMMILGVAAVAWFGMGHGDLGVWRVATFLSMFFLNAAIVGFYAAFARGFPAYARATGTGFVLGRRGGFPDCRGLAVRHARQGRIADRLAAHEPWFGLRDLHAALAADARRRCCRHG